MGTSAAREDYQSNSQMPPASLGSVTDSNHAAAPAADAPDTTLNHDAVIGPYNAEALAKAALAEARAISPDYIEAFVAGLRDVHALNALAPAKKRR